MKKTYHLCLSAGEEVMFRDLEDYNRGFNYFALALYKTNSTGLVESFMSNHFHLMIQTEDPVAFMHCMRMPYSKYFNRKYHREGMLGEKFHFSLEVVGLYHHLAAMSYVLRNALHHGIAPIPYAYPHSSVNAIFQKEMGKTSTEKLLPTKLFHRFIGKRAEYPEHYKMNEDGIFLRESVLDITQVENMFVTPRNFNYYMGRRTSEDWIKEQEKDPNGSKPISLGKIETGICLGSLDQMLANEAGRNDYRKLTDIDICSEIDKNILAELNIQSVYQLNPYEKRQIAEQLYRNHHLTESQIRRCLVL